MWKINGSPPFLLSSQSVLYWSIVANESASQTGPRAIEPSPELHTTIPCLPLTFLKRAAPVAIAAEEAKDLIKNEIEKLKYVGENYKNVVVLVNSCNIMELSFMDTIKGLDAPTESEVLKELYRREGGLYRMKYTDIDITNQWSYHE